MAADLVVRGEMDVAGVVNGMRKVSQSAKDLQNSSTGAGRGFLAVSQGIEDFTFAGLRGVLNNVPQAIQAFGGSAGLAASASVAGVAIYVLTEQLDKLWNKLADAKLETLSSSTFGDIGGWDARKKSVEETTIALKTFKTVSDRATSESEKAISTGEGYKNEVSVAAERLNLQLAILEIEKSKSTEAEKALAIRRETEASELRGLDNKLKESRLITANVSADAEGKRVAADASKSQLEIEKAKLESLSADARKKLAAASADRLAHDNAQVDMMQPGIEYFGNFNRSGNLAERKAAERTRLAMKRDEDLGNMQKGLIPVINAQATIVGQYQAQYDIQKQIAEEADKAQLAKEDELRKIEAVTEANRAQLSVESQRKDLAEAGKLHQNILKIKDASRISPDGFLSSSGAMGLSGREAVGALQAINVQKDQLRVLHEIARNTKGGKVALYAD